MAYSVLVLRRSDNHHSLDHFEKVETAMAKVVSVALTNSPAEPNAGVLADLRGSISQDLAAGKTVIWGTEDDNVMVYARPVQIR